ncbi:malto-oligosyltrehalose trehalohydrolase [Bogoriella caseilytica]|uniref:Malto-oligosyltrehalose trehalohydrolase n=1 Tax=Bogoriella caseilytica TaxID=56055 RepID=A0A3N2BGE2_9MICO|nr:malto-oligosyltrehalose trehalohydrolase [Bogoriella caseilytica]ROR74300.1 maltooligosyl trehalose hydrolase [Bogoriella caseilytica]
MSQTLRVWAPAAQHAELLLGAPGSAERSAMVAEDGGWWRSADVLAPGTDYAFSLDGGPALPDPRSPWQPHGVHEPSRTFDAAAHRWQSEDWAGRSALGSVMYELHIGTFTEAGTLDGAIERLYHLVDLGVETVELMPVNAFPGTRGWGYDGVALWAVQESYGGPAALQRFVDAAHQRGLAVCLDVVYNHLGPDGNYLAQFGPYFTDQHSTPWGPAVNLDAEGAHEVRQFVIDCSLRWMRDFRIDALRIDAVHALRDDSPRHILSELADHTAALSEDLGRPLTLIAESDLNDPVMVTPTGDGGFGMDGQWADDVHHALHSYLTGEQHGYYSDFGSAQILAKALTGVFVHDGSYSSFRGQHWGAPVPESISGHRFVVFDQNHDQVGNRALGDRPSQALSPGELAASAALLLLGPYTPMLFMGQEWGARTPFQYFTDHRGDLGEAVRQGRTAEFGTHGWAELYGTEDLTVPDPQSEQTFRDSTLDWQEADQPGPHAELLDWYRQLIALRRAEPDLSSGDRTATTCHWGEGWLVMRRGDIEVAVNLPRGETPPVGEGTILAEWPGAVTIRT